MKKLLYISISIFYFSLFTFDVISQPSITWQRNYNNWNLHDDGARGICQSTLGTYFIVGVSGNAHVMKINDNGDSLWSKVYPSIRFLPTTCVATIDNGLIMVGEREGNSRAKIDVNGGIVWNIPNDTFPCEFYDIIKTSDNNYIVCGSANTPIIGYIMKFDSFGQLLWDKYYNTSGYMRLYSITEAYNNGFLVCGVENDNVNPSNQGLVIRIDNYGNEIWRKYPMPSIYGQSCNSVRKFLNNFVLVGGSDSSRIIKIDTSGNTIFQKLYPKPQGAVSWLTSEIRGEVYGVNKILLYRNLGSLNNAFTTIAKIDSNFNEISFTRLDFVNGFTLLTSCLPLPNKDILFAGSVDIYTVGANFDFYVIRTDSTLYSPLLEIKNISTNVPETFDLRQNYPNPFNPNTNIRFQLPSAGLTQIKIYDILGREVRILVNKYLNAGIYEVEFDASNQASGIYFYSMETNGFKDTKKMILTK